jgi:hypothetical protein
VYNPNFGDIRFRTGNNLGDVLTIKEAGNVGIGTSSPAYKLDAVGSIQSQGTHGAGSFNAFIIKNTLNSEGSGKISWQGSSSNETWAIAQNQVVGAGFLEFNYLGSNKAVLDSSGNLGLGVTPSAWNGIYRAAQFDAASISSSPNYNNVNLGANYFRNASNTAIYIRSDFATYYDQDDGKHVWAVAPSGTAGDAISFTQAMTLTAGPELLVNCTSTPSSTVSGVQIANPLGTATKFSVGNLNSGVAHIQFLNGNGVVGSISTDGSATAYNTSSDYRLKNITGPITTSGAYIDSLNPVEGTWKADGSTFVGLIAHEVQEASRTSVATGVKDGEEMQGMDYSSAEIIANLIAEVKSLRQRVAALEA